MRILDKASYKKIIPLIQSADINTLFALFVLEGKVEGRVFVDEIDSPSSVYIQHPYGMALLYGETENEDFNAQLFTHILNLSNERSRFEWLQAYPASLCPKIERLLGAHLIKKEPNEPYEKTFSQKDDKNVLEYQRINFDFSAEKYQSFKNDLISSHYKIVETTDSIFNSLEGSVIPIYFWKNSNDFIRNGIGFSLLLNDDFPASTAFASFIVGNKLEIGIETVKRHRGKGFGALVCSALIDYCFAHGYEPVWSCLSGNIGSRKLAQKLGFAEKKRIPYYRLAK